MNRQFYQHCEIYCTIAFICSGRKTLFQNYIIQVRISLPKKYNTTTTQQRELENTSTGVVFQNCALKANQDMNNIATYLGRQW
ncbi:hypothetical protein H5410_040109 [Solanum commersonii]|uniref:Pectinesterase catalytic domain-containing protein n=1 Tax=Solanum commersonii TaxID=4109 RepID=A0A9J5XMY2_SOLCO|nr:hypothetical protein H5410_040109 [Solanum commersonii]